MAADGWEEVAAAIETWIERVLAPARARADDVGSRQCGLGPGRDWPGPSCNHYPIKSVVIPYAAPAAQEAASGDEQRE